MKLEQYDAYVLDLKGVYVHKQYPSSNKPRGTVYIAWVHYTDRAIPYIMDSFVYKNCGMTL